MKELSAETGVSARQIRYLISLGLVPDPHGSFRWAEYDQEHVDAIRRWQLLKSEGHKATSMTKAFRSAPLSLEPIPGVSVMIQSDLVSEAVDVETLKQQLAEVLGMHLTGKEIEDDRS